MYLNRIITSRLKQLTEAFPVIVISGARQVGKSTLVQHVFGKTHDYVVFDPAIDIENARQDPELFLDNHRTPLILDEIQYAPEVVSAIKRRIDIDRSKGQYILTGSQQWGILKSISESLAGRAVFLDLEGFCLSEICKSGKKKPWLSDWLSNPEAFFKSPHKRLELKNTLYEQLFRGWLPEAQFLKLANIPDYYTAYLKTYVERDVRILAEISDWQLFGRFVRLAAALSAREINFSQLGRELGLTPKTAARWIDILKATFQWFEIPAYSGNTLKRISNKPKGYLADTGIACTAQAISSPTAIGGHPLQGPLFETAVVGEIRKLCSVLSPKPIIYHWRSYAGAEVDMLLERDGIFYPVEIKCKTNPGRKDLAGITAFRKTYSNLKIEKGMVICPVEKIIQISENDYAVPWDLE